MKNLALFDFDGTITTRDTFTPFILRTIEPRRLAWGKVLLGPLMAAYKLGLVSASRMRQAVIYVGFRGRPGAEVHAAGLEYSRTTLAMTVRPKALERIKWHQEQGDDVVVVSASLDVYLADWCSRLGVQLICTELEQRDGILTGRYRDGDCTAKNKSRRIQQRFDLTQYKTVYAYGDTEEDREMLALAHQPFYRWPALMD